MNIVFAHSIALNYSLFWTFVCVKQSLCVVYLGIVMLGVDCIVGFSMQVILFRLKPVLHWTFLQFKEWPFWTSFFAITLCCIITCFSKPISQTLSYKLSRLWNSWKDISQACLMIITLSDSNFKHLSTGQIVSPSPIFSLLLSYTQDLITFLVYLAASNSMGF